MPPATAVPSPVQNHHFLYTGCPARAGGSSISMSTLRSCPAASTSSLRNGS